MNNRTLYAWIFVLLVPLVPVVLLYLFFQNQNYFELKDAATGIYALGPIAAYIGLVLIGWRIYSGLEKSGRFESPYLKELLGEWEMTSKSVHGTKGSGQFQIDEENGQLNVTGSMREEGQDFAQWKSEIASLKDRTLYIYYTMSQLKGASHIDLNGMCRLSIARRPIKEMEGQWYIVGEDYTAGEMKCNKKEKTNH